MGSIYRWAETISRALAILGSVCVVVMMLNICLDVATRNLFRTTIPFTPELVARYFMVGIAFLPLGWIEQRREMVSVEVLDAALPAIVLKASDILVGLVSTAIYAVLGWVTWGAALTAFNRGTFVQVLGREMPVWHSYFLPPIGFTLAALSVLILTIGRPVRKPQL